METEDISAIFRTTTVIAGLVLLFSGLEQAEGTPQKILAWELAAPFFALALFPGKKMVYFSASFQIGFVALLAPALWLTSFLSSISPYPKTGAYTGAAIATTFYWIITLSCLVKTPPAERGRIPGGIFLGLIYFPVCLFFLKKP